MIEHRSGGPFAGMKRSDFLRRSAIAGAGVAGVGATLGAGSALSGVKRPSHESTLRNWINRVAHVVINVSDLERSRAFHESVSPLQVRVRTQARGRLPAVTTWALDLDGVLWRGAMPIPGAAEGVARLRARGERVVFLTNNAAPTVSEQLASSSGWASRPAPRTSSPRRRRRRCFGRARPRCRRWLELADFPPNRRVASGRSSWCRQCHRAASQAWRSSRHVSLELPPD